MRAIAIAMYILCAIPLFIFSELGYSTLGLCFTLLLIAAATYLILINRKNSGKKASDDIAESPSQALKESIGTLIRSIALCVFFLTSFLTGAWYITWLIFPIAGCVRGLVNAVIDLKEVVDYEA